ncbi:Hypothetical protein HDN1F_29320 [gamma proteobacterium HdN1]|nr:Hypothetical protein HDN1F_29320 [gamma proteobacterium HdN1]
MLPSPAANTSITTTQSLQPLNRYNNNHYNKSTSEHHKSNTATTNGNNFAATTNCGHCYNHLLLQALSATNLLQTLSNLLSRPSKHETCSCNRPVLQPS